MIYSTTKYIFCIFLVIKYTGAKNCTCIPFYECEDDYPFSEDKGLNDVINLNGCEDFLHVCCKTPNTTTQQNPQPIKRCGVPKSTTFPWSADLLYKETPSFVPSFQCRASLIHKKIAITAAHCLQEKGYYRVRIGKSVRSVTHTTIHPHFNPENLHNDIVILFLNKPFHVGKISTICIPPPEIFLNGSNCTVVTTGKRGMLGKLKVISLPVVDRKVCVEKLRQSLLGEFFQLDESFICAGGEEGQDTCPGDGGSALVCPVPGVPGRYQQVGVVSWGMGCGDGFPGVYVNLGYFRDWIDEVIVEKGFDKSSYRV